MSERTISLFACLRFSTAYWDLDADGRQAVQQRLLDGLHTSKMTFALYQAYPLHTRVDVVLWVSAPYTGPETPDTFFAQLGDLLAQQRRHIETETLLWGITRASDYARGKSAQEIDPFDGQRSRYLVVYPFTKTAEWYRHSRDSRQGMMNEHIRIGHQYPEIKQLLLYSTGLQDQEFVVTYEMDDLAQFSALVTDLRASEARRFTALDTPVITAVHRGPADVLKLFG